jgi:hypothetical protein
MRQMFLMVGQRQIVDFLREQCRQQEGSMPENVLRRVLGSGLSQSF